MPSLSPRLPLLQTAAGQTVTRPQKVDEGLLLGALEVAARQGHIELAEIAWQVHCAGGCAGRLLNIAGSGRLPQLAAEVESAATRCPKPVPLPCLQLLERSVALPNTPAVGHSAPSTQQPGLGQQEEGGAGSAAEGLGAAAAAELASASIAAADAAAASGEQAAADPAADSNGVRGPSAAAHLALIHAYAKAGQLAPMLEAVERLAQVRPWCGQGQAWRRSPCAGLLAQCGRRRVQLSCLLPPCTAAPWLQAYPGDPAAAAYHGGLLMAVDALAASPQRCDAAFHLLERWAQEVRSVCSLGDWAPGRAGPCC